MTETKQVLHFQYFILDCSRNLDIIILLDGSGPVNKRTKERWDEIKEFALKFMKGFDEKARFGIIKYGGDPEFVMSLFTTKRTHEVLTMFNPF